MGRRGGVELINTTPIPAELLVSDLSAGDGATLRMGTLVAKATYRLRARGDVILSEEPMAVLEMEQPTELGFIPRDIVPPRRPGLDLVMLAAAYAPGGRPVTELSVELAVGAERWRLAVTGDRSWIETSDGWTMGPPTEFIRMPLTWSRAFGGTADVWIDTASPVEVCHPYNPAGRGFDPRGSLHGIERAVRCPEGFPRLDHQRLAPNVEHPDRRVAASDDAPEPYCWSPIGLDLGLRGKWIVDRAEARAGRSLEAADGERLADELPDEGMWFGHPDLRRAAPAAHTLFEVTCVNPRQHPFSFAWPALRVVGDYLAGSRSGVRELEPQMLVLMPDHQIFTITYRTWFRFAVEDEASERSIRLRLTQ